MESKKPLKKLAPATLGVGLLVAAQAAFGKGGGSTAGGTGKGSLGVNTLSLDELPTTNAQVCYAPAQQISSSQVVPNEITVAVANTSSTVQMTFSVGDVLPSSKDNTLFLAYSDAKTTTPAFATPSSSNSFALAGGLQLLAVYSIPALADVAQPQVSIGQASSKPRAKMVFEVNLSPAKIAQLISSSKNKIYFQAGIVPSADLAANRFDSMILSEVDTVTFAATCPTGNTSVTANGSGGKSVSTSGGTSLGKSSTGSKTSSSTSTGSKTTTGSSTGSKTTTPAAPAPASGGKTSSTTTSTSGGK
ncbi:MAG: hypothetical protein ACYC2R_01590 [Burkholderiales bacterium]